MKWLAPVELLYQQINRTRRALYRSGRLRARRLPRPVVSVGNIVVGGAGKTPTTIVVARQLMQEGLRVCILTRGHGREDVERIALVDAIDAVRFGDEPSLIHAMLPDAAVVVGRDRYAAGNWFLQSDDCDLFLLDDGFQHLQLARDVDLVVDVPRHAYAREPRTSLGVATAIITRDGANGWPGVPSFDASLSVTSIDRGGVPLELSVLRDARVHAFAGLADNEQFFNTLRNLGADVVRAVPFRDHHRYVGSELQELREAARADSALLVTTAKDAVKMPGSDVHVVRVELQIERMSELVRLILRGCRIA